MFGKAEGELSTRRSEGKTVTAMGVNLGAGVVTLWSPVVEGVSAATVVCCKEVSDEAVN